MYFHRVEKQLEKKNVREVGEEIAQSIRSFKGIADEKSRYCCSEARDYVETTVATSEVAHKARGALSPGHYYHYETQWHTDGCRF